MTGKVKIAALLWFGMLTLGVTAAAAVSSGAVFSDPVLVNTDAASEPIWTEDRTPSLTSDGHGNWMAVWVRRPTGEPDRVQVARSTDNGATWTDPEDLSALYPSANAFPHIATDGNGLWMTIWAGIGIRLASSTDEGRTWTDSGFLGDGYRPYLETDGLGNWVAIWQTQDTSAGEVVIARSEDHGATWSTPAEIGLGWNACLVTDKQGNWLVVWAFDYDIFFSRSTDAGTTWTDPVPLDGDGTDDNLDALIYPHQALATDGHGNWIAVWFSPEPDSGKYRNLYVRSADDGVTWTSPAVLDADPDFSPLQSVISADRAGNWIALSHSDGVFHRLMRSNTNGRTWTDPERFSSWQGRFLRIASDESGNWVMILNSRSQHIGDVFVGGDGDIVGIRFAFCEIVLHGWEPTTISFVPGSPGPQFDVLTGNLSDLWFDADFSGATCLGASSGDPVTDDRPVPMRDEGYYYLGRALSGICAEAGYGDSSLDPDPRRDLDVAGPCP